MENVGKLSVVATPIGNLGDITLRAIETLKQAEMIFCEDTRVTGKLLQHLEIPKKELVRADAEKEVGAAAIAAAHLRAGKHIVYVSDAGTPGISDPGGRLVEQVRREVPEATIEAIPGVSAVTAALSIAGLNTDSFTFLGFVPHKKGRQTFFEGLASFLHPVVFFESPHRIQKTLASLVDYYPQAQVSLGRELTKMHEELLVGTPADIIAILENNKEKIRGEFILILQIKD